MKCIVFTQAHCNIRNLQPFSLTRRVQEFRIGALRIREKWELSLGLPSLDLYGESNLPDTHKTIAWSDVAEADKIYLIQCNLLPSKALLTQIKKLKPGEALISSNQQPLVHFITKENINKKGEISKPVKETIVENATSAIFFTQLFALNSNALLFDFNILIKSSKFIKIDKSNAVSSSRKIFIEEGAVVKHCIINADDGPVYISKNALVMEGSCIRGPVFVGENAVVKMGTKIYGATTIGPGCTVGGEIKNSIFFANSNKAHDGYLGDSVIGEWCNFGAGTSCSNMKNTVGNIDYDWEDTSVVTNQKKVGVMMGDYSRTAINTSINTGTVIGVSAHVFGIGLTPKFIPNFSWGFNEGQKKKYDLKKALKDADAWKKLKGSALTENEKKILTEIFNKL